MSASGAYGQSITIDFEEVSPSIGALSVVESKGFSFSNPAGTFVASGPSYCSPECPGGTGHFIIVQGTLPSGHVTLQRDDGQSFSLVAFDCAETNVGTFFPGMIQVDGVTPSGSNLTPLFVTLDGVNDGSGPLVDWQHAILPDTFANVKSVAFGGMDNSADHFSYSLDNIQVSPPSQPIAIPALGTISRALMILLVLGAAKVALNV
jgi:hypothetical protein